MTYAQYILTGSVTKTGDRAFLLELSVADTETGERRASYPPVYCTLQELAGIIPIKQAAEDILEQLGIRLTEAGRAALYTLKPAAVDGEIALSKGVAAQRNGTIAEALSYYYDAVSFDDSLSEAEERLTDLSSAVSKGAIGQSIRTELERRNAWLQMMKDCEAFFTAHLPYKLVYEPSLTKGRINYETGLADLSFIIVSYPTDGFKPLKTIADGLTATGKKGEWNLGNWPLSSPVFVDEPGADQLGKGMTVEAVLINEAGTVLAVKEVLLVNRIGRNLTTQAAGATVIFEAVNIQDLTDAESVISGFPPGLSIRIKGT